MICLFPNCAFISETSRMIEIFRALRQRGCAALVATHGGPYEFLLKQEQVPYHRIEPTFSKERAEEFLTINRMEKLFGEFYTPAELSEHVKSEIELFSSNKVNIVHGGFTLSNAISARKVGARYSVTHGMVPLIFEKNLQPWPDELERLPISLLPEHLKVRLINLAMLRSKRFAGPFNSVAKEYGVPQFKSFLEVMLGDCTYVTDVPEVMGIDPQEFFCWAPTNPNLYSRKMTFKPVGPIFAQFSMKVPDSIRDFLKGHGQKSIYVALTSTKREYVDATCRALTDFPGKVVFSTNLHSKVVRETENIRVCDYLPSQEIMPLVDLAIIHGGQGSIQTAVASGTPIVGFPLQAEQKFNLRMVETQGAGVCMSLKELLAGRLSEMIEKVLSASSFKTNALRLKKAQESYRGADSVAEDLIAAS